MACAILRLFRFAHNDSYPPSFPYRRPLLLNQKGCDIFTAALIHIQFNLRPPDTMPARGYFLSRDEGAGIHRKG